jgi:energy-coupling factor transport system permease protein
VRPRLAYRPGGSALHRLHPLIKAGWLLLLTVDLFVIRTPWIVLGVLGTAAAAFPLCGLPWRELRGRWLLASTAALLAALQLVFVRDGDPLGSVGALSVTTAGLEAAIYVAGRFAAVVLLSYLFVLTTDPSQLARALVGAGLPYRWAFAGITALRLVAVFESEALTIRRAQLARGVRHDAGGVRRGFTVARQLVLPLLVSAIGRVDALSVSMEGRCFGRHPDRSWLIEVRFGVAEVLHTVLLSAAIGGTVVALLLL